MAPKIVDKREKREKIVTSAIQVFSSKGFERTRMDDIAKAAGIGKGTIYEYFSDKETLMNASFEFLFESFSSQEPNDFEPTDSASDKLRKVTWQLVNAMESLGHAYRFFLEYLLFLSRKGEKYGLLEKILVEYRELLTAIIEEGKTSGEFRSDVQSTGAAASFAAWFDGAIFHVIVLPNISMREMADHFLDMTLTGFVDPKPKA